MPITLWAEHATKLNNFIQDRDNGEPVIVILQFGKKKYFPRFIFTWYFYYYFVILNINKCMPISLFYRQSKCYFLLEAFQTVYQQ